MAATFRAPFEALTGGSSYDFAIDDFDTPALTRLSVQRSDSEPPLLQPIFPGKLSFNPRVGLAIPPDPRASPVSIVGDLFLEQCAPAVLKTLGELLPRFKYPLTLAYRGVELTKPFFDTLPTLSIDALTSRQQYAGLVANANKTRLMHDFTAGKVSATISVEQFGKESNLAFATVPVGVSSVDLVCGVRVYLDPFVKPPALNADGVLAPEHFVALPLAFLFRLLREAQGWNAAAVPAHRNHVFFEALAAAESRSIGLRWQHLRLLQPDSSPATPGAHSSLQKAVATGTAAPVSSSVPTPPDWSVPVNLLGDIFVLRPTVERFDLQVYNALAERLPLVVGDAQPTDSLAMSWDGSLLPAALSVGVEVVSRPSETSEFFTALLPVLQRGVADCGGLTVDEVNQVVLDTRPWVRLVAESLVRLGFALAKPATAAGDCSFTRELSWAVREFQIYARMTTFDSPGQRLPQGLIARESNAAAPIYADRLVPTPNPLADRYTGEITGIVDAETTRVLRIWLQKEYRCPVVAETWNSNQTTLANENLWLAAGDNDTNHRFFVIDKTGRYAVPTNHQQNNRVVLGTFFANGIVTFTQHTWKPDTNITPLRLVGRQLDPNNVLQAATIATYKVIAAVALAECSGVFDSLNAWDRAIVSYGVFHWTLFLSEGKSELPAFLAFLNAENHNEFQRLFGDYGLELEEVWSFTGMFILQERKWASRTMMRGLPISPANPQVLDPAPRALQKLGANDQAEAEYYRNLHWYYRFVMACRTSPVIWRLQWHTSRMRIRAILGIRWGAHPGQANLANLTIGDVYRTELAVGMLLRAHVNVPGSVIRDSLASPELHQAVEEAGLNGHDPQAYTQIQHRQLIEELEKRLTRLNATGDKGVYDEIRKSLHFIREYNDVSGDNLGGLSDSVLPLASSFTLDIDGLP